MSSDTFMRIDTWYVEHSTARSRLLTLRSPNEDKVKLGAIVSIAEQNAGKSSV